MPGGNEKRTAHRLSKEGKWRSFSRLPHLLQYVSSGAYFARSKAYDRARVGIVLIWESKAGPNDDYVKPDQTQPND